MKQYQIVLVNLDPTVGAEMEKTRYAVIVSPDEMNDALGTVIICPITTTGKEYPSRIAIKSDHVEGFICIDHIRSVSKQRIVKEFSFLEKLQVMFLRSRIREMLVE